MRKTLADEALEAAYRFNRLFDNQRHSAEDARKLLEELDRRKPEWLRERQRQMDEAYTLKQREARNGADEGWPLAALAAGSIALGGAVCSSAPNNSQTTAQTDSTQTDSDSEDKYDSEGCHPVGNRTRAGDLIDCASEWWQKHKPNFGGSNSGSGLGTRPKTAKNIRDAASRKTQ